MAITVIFNILQNEHRPIILSLADFITSPWRRLRGYLRKKPTHRFSPLSELTHRNTQFENKFGYFMLPSRYMRSAIVYRTVYGIKMPKVSPFFYKPQKSWQEWELEAATALGLNVIKVEINVDHENQIPITENTIRLNDERLENKLSKVVLPQLKNSYRKPYQVQTGFLKFLLLLLAGLMLCLITLLFIIIVLLYSIVVGIIHYVAI